MTTTITHLYSQFQDLSLSDRQLFRTKINNEVEKDAFFAKLNQQLAQSDQDIKNGHVFTSSEVRQKLSLK
ncbi:MAG: hypothetical protein LBM97_00690 [Candidatus Nomurabacteria bacterium]|nr:hypothetical protein [Candidatus Nomurabacteria bacterium]